MIKQSNLGRMGTFMSNEYKAAMFLHSFLEQNGFKTLEEIYPAFRTVKDLDRLMLQEAIVLYGKMVQSRSLHIESVEDLKEAVDLLSVNDDGSMKNGGEDFIDVLTRRNPAKYYSEEDDCIVVTDTDFLNVEELLDDDYQAIYGVLYHKNEDYIYESLILTLRKMGTKVYKQITLSSWEEQLDTTIERLQHIKERYRSTKVRVRVPFFYYDADIAKTIAQYKYTRFLVKRLIQDTILDDEEVKDVSIEQFQTPKIKEAFLSLIDDYQEEGNMLYPAYIVDEMIRRGIIEDAKPSKYYNENCYRKYLLKDKHFDSSNDEEGSENNGELINKVGVLYCMLYGLVDDNSLLTKVAHYAFNDNKEFKERASSNTEYTYIAKPLDRLFDTFEKKAFIDEKLKQYGFPSGTREKIYNDLKSQKGA